MVTDEAETTKPEVVELEQALSNLLRGAINTRLHERVAAETGVALERACYWVLGCIAKRGPLRLSELAHTMGLDPSTVSRHVRQLEIQGLAERGADPSDARAVMLAPTAAGREILGRLLVARHQMLEKVLARWPDDDRQELARLLTRLAGDLTAAWQEVCP
ncbi:MAG TPA: MarR family transcriptional regulator [Actinomycetota bacterium]|jgi:DNA-binding MarR family transcriptional regulator